MNIEIIFTITLAGITLGFVEGVRLVGQLVEEEV